VLYSFRPDVVYVPAGWFDVEETALSIQEGIDAARAMGVEIRELSAGDSLQLPGRMQQDVYSPVDGIEPASVNDMSMLALLSCDAQQVLFTGDLSSAGEPERIPDADVLKVAHHGSDKATSERFLAACTPQIAVISVGENNYGHPGETTLEKLADIGAQVYQTRDCGAITLTWRKDAWRVDTFLEVTHEVE